MEEAGEFDYNRYARRKMWMILAGIGVCVVVFLIDILFSARYMNASDVLTELIHPNSSTSTMHVIVWEIRLPIVVTSLLAGAIFGFAGSIMQTMLNNPLASPYTLGISAGAGFGASLAMVVGIGGLAGLGTYMIPAAAFLFAMLACSGIFIIARTRDFASETMILAGIGLVFFFQALSTLMQYFASSEALSGIVFWTFGSVSNATWEKVGIMLVPFLLCFAYVYKNCWKMTALKLGDGKARSLGIDVGRFRKILFLIGSLVTAVAVAFVGCIGFVGIVGPHIARMILGEEQRFFIPMSAICGAAMLCTADIVTRVLTEGLIYPIGAITAIVGIPVFFYLVSKRKVASS